MNLMIRKPVGFARAAASAAALVLMIGLGVPTARADEAAAKGMLKAMSDYLAAQKTISFGYDTNFEVVTKDHQKFLLASSGAIDLNRPDKFRATRSGGFARVEMVFDGKTLTLLRKDTNVYSQVDIPGTLDHLVDQLRDKYQRPVPGADLLLSNVHDELMRDVVDVKDLGSGVIGGTECDHLAFRTVLLQGLQRLADRVEGADWRRQEHTGDGKAGASVQGSAVHGGGDPVGGALVSAVSDLLPRS